MFDNSSDRSSYFNRAYFVRCSHFVSLTYACIRRTSWKVGQTSNLALLPDRFPLLAFAARIVIFDGDYAKRSNRVTLFAQTDRPKIVTETTSAAEVRKCRVAIVSGRQSCSAYHSRSGTKVDPDGVVNARPTRKRERLTPLRCRFGPFGLRPSGIRPRFSRRWRPVAAPTYVLLLLLLL